MGKFFAESEPVRRWLYGLLAPVFGLLVFYGLLAEEAVALWLALGEVVLVPPVAEAVRARVTPVRE